MEPKFWVLDSTFRFTLEKCSKLKRPTYSPDNFWKMYVGPDDEKKFLKCYVKCKVPEVKTYSWTCDAIIELRILNKVDKYPGLLKVTKGILLNNTWLNFNKIIEWSILLDPNVGFIQNDEVVFEVHVSSNYASMTLTDDYTKGLLQRCRVDVDDLERKLKNKQLLLENEEQINNRKGKELEDLNQTVKILKQSTESLKNSSATKDALITSINDELSRLKSQNNELFQLVRNEDSRSGVINNGKLSAKLESFSRLNKKVEQLTEEKIAIMNEKTVSQDEKREVEEELIFEKKIKEDSLEKLKICQKEYKLALENVFQLNNELKYHKQNMKSARIELEKILNLADKNEIIHENIETVMKLLDTDGTIIKNKMNSDNFSNEVVSLQNHLEFILEVEESEKISKENTIKKLNQKLKELLSNLEKHKIISRKYKEKLGATISVIYGLKNHLEEFENDISTVWKENNKLENKFLLKDTAIKNNEEADTFVPIFPDNNSTKKHENELNFTKHGLFAEAESDKIINRITKDDSTDSDEYPSIKKKN